MRFGLMKSTLSTRETRRTIATLVCRLTLRNNLTEGKCLDQYEAEILCCCGLKGKFPPNLGVAHERDRPNSIWVSEILISLGKINGVIFPWPNLLLLGGQREIHVMVVMKITMLSNNQHKTKKINQVRARVWRVTQKLIELVDLWFCR